MFELNSPFNSQLIHILKEFTINKCEAKFFWQKIIDNNAYDKYELQMKTYQAIRTLIQNGYLTYEKSPTNPGVNLYTETNLLKEKRKLLLNKIELENDLHSLEEYKRKISTQLVFTDEIISKYPSLAYQILNHKNDLDNDYIDCEIKIETLSKIISNL